MKKCSFSILLIACACVAHVTAACAGEAERYQQARHAYQSKNLPVLMEATEAFKQSRSPLLPYLQYWTMILTMDQVSAPQIQAYFQENGDNLLTQRVRELWLKRLGKTQNWSEFLQVRRQMPPYYALNDTANLCYQSQAAMAMDDPNAFDDAKILLASGKELPADCQGLLETMQEVGVLDTALLLKLYREALLNNKVEVARFWAKRSTKVDADLLKQMDLVVQNPAQALQKGIIKDHTSYGRVLYLYAIQRQARADIALAQSSYERISWLFNTQEKQLAQALLAHEAARKHMPEASLWFAKVDKEVFTQEQWEWYARSALRQEDWTLLLAVIQSMPANLATESSWRYWKARALKVKGQEAEANQLLAKLAKERQYYGWLAAEELGPSIAEPVEIYQPNDDALKQFSSLPAMRRIDALFDAEARYEAKLEWQYLLEGMDDRGRIVAAQYAIKKSWFDFAVIASDKTTLVHNFELRYPTPYREYLQKAARERNVDEAWVYGIIRQESRFIHYAKSAVGAGGLMQVMPATAKWVAKKMGWSHYHEDQLHDIDTNVNLGTYYMRYTLDTFGGQEAMATAAYNAGPSRARQWAASVPLEGAIYTETIPFIETRNYVKKVLANAHMYAPRLGLPVVGLKKRLGVVPARVSAEASANGRNAASNLATDEN